MAEIVNLRMARKRRERDERERLAAENRIRHGTSKAERRVTSVESERAASALDGHRRDGRKGDD